MTLARIYDAAGRSTDFFYDTGEPDIVSPTAKKLVLAAEILSGRFEGETAVTTWIGDFDFAAGEGSVTEFRQRVDGELHFSLRFDAPVDLKAVLAGLLDPIPVTAIGNRFANVWRGDGAAERIFGNGGEDRLIGDSGRDRLDGGEGNDRLYGGNGADFLLGREGGDTLFGGDGRDRLLGGTGRDTLWGRDGADVFEFRTAREAGNDARADLIRDFGTGADKLDLSRIARELPDGADFVFIGDSSFSAIAGELRFKGDRLSGDLDGDGHADFRIAFTQGTEVTEVDLIL